MKMARVCVLPWQSDDLRFRSLLPCERLSSHHAVANQILDLRPATDREQLMDVDPIHTVRRTPIAQQSQTGSRSECKEAGSMYLGVAPAVESADGDDEGAIRRHGGHGGGSVPCEFAATTFLHLQCPRKNLL